MAKYTEGECARVVWLDSASLGGWHYDLSKFGAKVIESVGFVCALTDNSLILANSRSDSGGVIHPIAVPFCCILEYKSIELRPIPSHIQSK